MTPQPTSLTEFRHLVNRRAKQAPDEWDRSRALLHRDAFGSTLARLHSCIRNTPLPPSVQEPLQRALQPDARSPQDLSAVALKELTGLPAAKAMRALCIYFGLVERPTARWPPPGLSAAAVEHWLQTTANPFDLLLESEVASVLDLGAGDLSFASELADRYHEPLRRHGRDLVLHCVDRLDPVSSLGGPLHPDNAVLTALRRRLGGAFTYWGNQNMFDLRRLDEQGMLAPRYTITTCWAPATPTFAYEPARFSAETITEHLRRTKGVYRQTRIHGEAALEVQHGDRALLFPPWKFDIIGPLALLALVAERGCLCLLGSVDAQVFWEILAQLLADNRFRPLNTPFGADNIPEIFGEVFRTLERLPLGASMNLASVAPLRTDLPRNPSGVAPGDTYAFRYVEVRRGAAYPNAPASSTARKFPFMSEETTPWCLALVPA
jgi:hypothetical protein